MRADIKGKIKIKFKEQIVLADYENLMEEIQESGTIQLQLISQVDIKDS